MSKTHCASNSLGLLKLRGTTGFSPLLRLSSSKKSNYLYSHTQHPAHALPAGSFFFADTRLSLGHPAYGVHGHSGPESMYSMNWVAYSFMRARHVSMLGTLWGGGGDS